MFIGEAEQAAHTVWGEQPPVFGGATGGGGRFEMDAHELDSVIGLWEDQLKLITEDGLKISGIVRLLKSPGKDVVSSGYVTSGASSLQSLQDQNDSMKAYVTGYIRKLREAKTATAKTDQAGAESFTQAT
ncbi:hypothetical protein [Amycolatopsis sp. H20-H5]|uniref:hypothetical protein n=1 Tax=Amycolatopsis sp. H20-H5 TaxID=3046309 RepID=UPI002DBE9E3B|nr:hypothetical protein [Amycolatopsis sp. H20-H5]MEC3979993.1 hypothetical protein [Amycolatopsis sp. H20-H5]